MENYKTINQICEEYNISRKTVERWMKAGLPYIKLNNNNGSVRIKEEDLQKMINGKNSENPINRMRWGEYQAKMAISFDLAEAKKNDSTLIKNYDEFKLCYPQDFHVEVGQINLLINVVSIDKKDIELFSIKDQEERFRRNFLVEEHNLKIIILFVGFNNNLPQNKVKFDSNNVVNMISINLRDITNLDILQYINQY
ncbi:helix-turn-helix domain-containing protein [Bacillus cereus]|uniref:helix-turn-helix domain-containing protein n=1 Tax=Bacillus cereus TaxID=1396 RepID=UPI0011212B2F|nr:helix-turn-helix domain-containing protein [Bacillus cereus]MCH5460922.1 helix-turn-helix domain-containing protein [Bacillus cereus]TNO60864.1 helix-turn-helix domain-containing protein [Bacillus cereus]